METKIKSYTASILLEKGFRDQSALLAHVSALSDIYLLERGIRSRSLFISDLQRLINRLELDGDTVRETREMTKAGNLFESMIDYHLILRRAYLKRRKMLKEMLDKIAA